MSLDTNGNGDNRRKRENDDKTPHFKRADERLLVALASGRSIRQAARVCGLKTAAISRRLKEPEFQTRLREVRGQYLDRAIGILARSCAAASLTYRQLLKARSEQVRLGAARAIHEEYAHLRKNVEDRELLERLQREIQEFRELVKSRQAASANGEPRLVGQSVWGTAMDSLAPHQPFTPTPFHPPHNPDVGVGEGDPPPLWGEG